MDSDANVTGDVGATLAGRYRVDRLLGRGGMAVVYEGLDLRLGRTVAVKLLRPEIAAQPQFRDRFETEARSAATLSHPNVVAIFDTGEDKGRPFIVMECLPGPTVADRIARGPMGEEEATAMAAAVLAGLQAAHGAGLVHRDVKPGNVLVTAQGSWKVCDFGIAKALDALDTGLTTTGLLVGTPAYLAPERLTGAPATPASDIYSLGTVLYEALTATKPFGSLSTHALVASIQLDTPTPLRTLRPDVSPGFASVVERAMAKQPADRYPSATAMAEAISASAGGISAEGLSAGGPRPYDPTMVVASPSQGLNGTDTSWQVRHAQTVPLATSGDPTVVGPGGPALVRPGGRTSPPDAQLPFGLRISRRQERLLVPLAVLAVLVLVVVFALTRGGGPSSPHTGTTATTLSSGTATVPTTRLPPALSSALSNLTNQVRP